VVVGPFANPLRREQRGSWAYVRRTPIGRDDQVLASDTGFVQPSHTGTINEFPYALHGLPFEVPLTITVSPNGLAPSPGHLLRLEQVSGPPQPIPLPASALRSSTWVSRVTP
jgi:hypothetical protein